MINEPPPLVIQREKYQKKVTLKVSPRVFSIVVETLKANTANGKYKFKFDNDERYFNAEGGLGQDLKLTVRYDKLTNIMDFVIDANIEKGNPLETTEVRQIIQHLRDVEMMSAFDEASKKLFGFGMV